LNRPSVPRIQGEQQAHFSFLGRELAPKEFLKRVAPLNELPPDSLEELGQHAEYRRLAQGEYIVFECDTGCPAFLVASGRIAVMKSSAEGKDLNLGLLPPGDVFGLILALGEDPPILT